jgi:hypothetical protein
MQILGCFSQFHIPQSCCCLSLSLIR